MEILKIIGFITVGWIICGLVGRIILIAIQPKGYDFNVPKERAILFGYLTFIVGVILALSFMLPYDSNKHI